MTTQATLKTIQQALKLETLEQLDVSEFRAQTRVVIPADKLLDVVKALHDDRKFHLIIDITCVDYLSYPNEAPDRFGLVYQLADHETGERVRLRVYLGEEDPEIESLVPIYQGANWMEREVFDMFGIRFNNHPDLRRILMPEEFAAFPLRKDYPLQGRGERHNFPVITREQS